MRGQRKLKVGDVVYIEGTSAILGDVVKVSEENGSQYVDVAWRAVTTTEWVNEFGDTDLVLEEQA